MQAQTLSLVAPGIELLNLSAARDIKDSVFHSEESSTCPAHLLLHTVCSSLLKASCGSYCSTGFIQYLDFRFLSESLYLYGKEICT